MPLPGREAYPEDTAFCVFPGCDEPATTENVVGIDTEHVPPGDPDGFSWRTELVCADHKEGTDG